MINIENNTYYEKSTGYIYEWNLTFTKDLNIYCSLKENKLITNKSTKKFIVDCKNIHICSNISIELSKIVEKVSTVICDRWGTVNWEYNKTLLFEYWEKHGKHPAWNTIYKNTMGIVVRNKPAIVTGTSRLYLDLKTVIPTINVLNSSLGKNTNANKSSFQTHKAFTTISVVIGGPDKGIIIFVRILKVEQPSMIPASIISIGIVLKKLVNR